MTFIYKISRIQQLIQFIRNLFGAYFIKRSMGHCGKM